MQKDVVIIGHPEEGYAERLANYINEHGLMSAEAVAFSEKGRMTRFENTHSVLAKVVAKEWAESSRKSESGILTIILTDGEEEGDMYAFRFRAADLTAAKICEFADIKPGRKTRVNEKTKLIGVYSPVGRCLKTSFSLTLGQMLATKYRVLYLNFENYSGFGKVMGFSKPADMADLLYYFLNLSDEFPKKMEEVMVSLGGMDMIPPALSFMDLESITEDEWEFFFNTLIERGNYDYIILDLSDYVKGLYGLLKRCYYIYTMMPGDGLAMAKVEQYEKLLKSMHYGDILDRTKKLFPPIFRKLPIHPEELLHSELAEYTRKITEDDFAWSGKK